MILVPHQDDEILMAAGLIYELRQRDLPLSVVMATNGDYECKDHSKGEARLRESLAGLHLLGVPEEDFIILGYADTGMEAEVSFLTGLLHESDEYRVHPSACGCETYSLPGHDEWHRQVFGEHGPYHRKGFVSDLKSLLETKLPNRIFTTAPFDLHGDHDALFCFLEEVLKELSVEKGYEPQVYCGVIHSCAGDDVWPPREMARFSCPKGLWEKMRFSWEDRYILELPEELSPKAGSENLKYRALCMHETALEPDAVDFLMAFIKEEELFWRMQ